VIGRFFLCSVRTGKKGEKCISGRLKLKSKPLRFVWFWFVRWVRQEDLFNHGGKTGGCIHTTRGHEGRCSGLERSGELRTCPRKCVLCRGEGFVTDTGVFVDIQDGEGRSNAEKGKYQLKECGGVISSREEPKFSRGTQGH